MIEAFLNFSGQAREAAGHYAAAFGGEITFLETYERLQEEEPGLELAEQDRVMHCTVETFAGKITLSDHSPGQDAPPTAAFSLAVSHHDMDRLRAAFDALKTGGQVLLPLEPAFFSPLYGMLEDRFGYSWIFMGDEAPEKQASWRDRLRLRIKAKRN